MISVSKPSWRGLMAGLTMLGCGGADEPSANTLPAEWSTTASSVRARVGERFTVSCPPNGRSFALYGTHLYNHDSSICNAAVHAGLITRERGGTARIVIRPGVWSVQGTDRNGVRSSGAEFTSVSSGAFAFVDDPHPIAQATQLIASGWISSVHMVRDQVGRRFSFGCPANPSDPRICYGTDLYAQSSSVCAAAVNAGRLDPAQGGIVEVEVRGAAEGFTASTRNGRRCEGQASQSSASFVFP